MSSEINKTVINEITKRLVKAYNPLAIYLFGSHAWGTPQENSDIDFFIIVENSNLDSAERIRVGLRVITDLKLPVDILVYTKNEVDDRKTHPSTLAHKVITKGLKLYEAA